jgi:ectoine hydroxylase
VELTDKQIQQFNEEGYIFIPSCFSTDEVKVLNDAASEIFMTDRKEVWRESSGIARTAFAAHTYNEAHKKLAAHPKLIQPVKKILDGEVYMHQYKINAKAAFDGEVWQWHQDFGTWHRDDGMPEPRAMNIALFLDDVTAANGPLLFLPKSHKKGIIAAGHDIETTSYPLWTLDRETVSKLCDQGGCVAPTGPAGSVIMFSSLLVHASPANISPLPRTIVYLSLCHVDNHITRYQREEWIAHRNFDPIIPLDGSCLTDLETNNSSVAAE